MDAAGSDPKDRTEAAGAVPALELRHAAKSFGAVRALIDGSVTLRGGEVHALVGENGAGKSTLVKVLAGVYQPDSGTLTVAGREVTLHGPAAARSAGIAVIYQEPTLFPDLSVAENVFIGRQPLRQGRRIDRRAMQDEAAAVFKRLGVPLDPARIARGLSIADQQVVEIGKALSLDAKVIVMDEPTRRAVRRRGRPALRGDPRPWKSQQAAVMFISHRLEEVFALCQRVTVMRDGRHVLTSDLAYLQRERPGARHGRPGTGRAPAGDGRRRAGRADAHRRAPHARGRLHRHLVHRAVRRDRGPRRPGRLRPQRGSARGVRHRPLRRRKYHDKRAKTEEGLADDGHGRWHRLRA